jgi:hypothetical protein
MTFSSRGNEWRAFALVAGMLGGGLLLPEPSAASNSLRCDNQLVQEGDSQYEVKSLCGLPHDVQQRTETRRVQRAVQRPCARGSGLCAVVVDHYVDIVVDEWIYDFGPRRFLQYLTFEGGQLVAVRSGPYGHKL